MNRFRKKPIVIEAEQFDPEISEVERMGKYGKIWYVGVYEDPEASTGYSIDTLEGKHTVTPKDWIIRGVKGETYPCKPDIFEMTYEPVYD